jgi:transcriptional regulator with XRE-family HTH domain
MLLYVGNMRAPKIKANGDAIRAIRERSGVTQADIARRCGVDPAVINRIEAGGRPGRPEVIGAIALALKVPVTAIIHDC